MSPPPERHEHGAVVAPSSSFVRSLLSLPLALPLSSHSSSFPLLSPLGSALATPAAYCPCSRHCRCCAPLPTQHHSPSCAEPPVALVLLAAPPLCSTSLLHFPVSASAALLALVRLGSSWTFPVQRTFGAVLHLWRMQCSAALLFDSLSGACIKLQQRFLETHHLCAGLHVHSQQHGRQRSHGRGGRRQLRRADG